ncbi:MAG: acyltransferase [Bacteroidota bacterium]
MKENKIQFHTLDALRFFAFLKVYLLHVPLQGNFPVFSFLKSGGGFGVSFFFVLSGFLITYLLSAEKKNTGQINLKKFFLRRSFRIWPLYFLILIIIFLLPFGFKEQAGLHITGGYNPDWKYSFSFLENYVMLYKDCYPITTPLSIFWSLCIEEHFYIVWMLLVFFIPFKKIHYFLITAIVLSWVARYAEPCVFQDTLIRSNDLFTNADFFASGGILGYLVARNYESISGLSSKIVPPVKYSLILFIILILIFHEYVLPGTQNIFYIINPTLIAILFAMLIFILIPQDSKIRIGKKNILSYLGRISYGLYVYHLIFIHITFQYFINHKIILDDWGTLSLYILITFGGTVLLSMISFHFFEKPFLQLREKIFKSRVAASS